jgi:localization factor PodJL
VQKIQLLLADHGYDPGPADGVAGPRTREAVRAFQRRTGIAETGEIDGDLVAVLAGTTI